MADKIKPQRLIKVAKEFNLGLDSIAEFLQNKGFEASPSPTFKVSPEMYQSLVTQFQGDRDLRARAEKITIGTKERQRIEVGEKGSIKVSEKKPEVAEVTPPPPPAEKPKPVAEKVENIAPPVLQQPTIIEPVKPAPKPVVEKKPTPKVEEPAPKIEAKTTPTPPKEVKKVVEPKKVEEVVAPKPPVVEKAPPPPKEVEKTVAPPKVEKEATPASSDAPNIPKVLGKIDLSAIQQNNRRKKSSKSAGTNKDNKSKASKSKTVKQQDKNVASTTKPVPTPLVPPVKKETPKPVAKAEEEVFMAREKIELAGPKILGKIELPTKTDSRDDKKKKKRKRINKPQPKRITVVTKDNSSGGTRGGGGNRSGGGTRGGGITRGKKNDRRGKAPAKGNEITSVSEKAIQDKIRLTMAKLSGGSSGSGKNRQQIRRKKRDTMAEKAAIQEEMEAKPTDLLEVTEFISVSELASLMDISATDIIMTCMNLGTFVSINQRLDAELIEIICDEYNFQVKFLNATEEEEEEEDFADAEEDLEERSPIVTVMGHVDHGKTSLLDYIRSANVIAGEMGGITQHIGAYEVLTDSGKTITFLDTPGHEAFTAMRARGAKITDVAVIVIASDDAVMPQTKEAISHAQAAGVPMIFALNKMDKEGSNPEKIREQLAGMNILLEDWGGKFQAQEISAKFGKNIDELLEKILLEAELLELKANPNRGAVGSILEASLDKGRGFVSTILVQNGTLKIGDVVVAGATYGKIKAMYDERGKRVMEADPSTPVQILGLNGAPQAGEKIKAFESENEAKDVATKRELILREQGRRTKKHITLDEIGRRLALDNFQELNLIVKGDFDGSVEALSDSLLGLSTEEIQINVIHKSVGQISESDVLLASASDAIIVGFQVRPSTQARQLAEKEDIDIRLYSIIYDAIDEIKSAMEGLLKPRIVEEVVCNIEVRDVFKISKVGTIAGCYVQTGKVKRHTKVRLIRDGVVKYSGELASLKRFKEDVKEVGVGFECGLNIKNYNDIRVGDIIEGYEEKEVKRKLGGA